MTEPVGVSLPWFAKIGVIERLSMLKILFGRITLTETALLFITEEGLDEIIDESWGNF